MTRDISYGELRDESGNFLRKKISHGNYYTFVSQERLLCHPNQGVERFGAECSKIVDM